MIEEIKEQIRQYISDRLSEIYADYSSYDELKESVSPKEWEIICAINQAENCLCL